MSIHFSLPFGCSSKLARTAVAHIGLVPGQLWRAAIFWHGYKTALHLQNPNNLPFPFSAEIEEEVNGQLNESEKKTVIQCQNKVDGLKKR
jgi:hypothetical protein